MGKPPNRHDPNPSDDPKQARRKAGPQDSPASTKKGRPRDPEAYQAILKAARRFAREKTSYKDVSIEAIANEARSSKATIYRWWESKALLLREACWMNRFKAVQEKDLESDLIRMIQDEVRVQTEFMNRSTYAGTIAELIDLACDPKADPSRNLCPYEVETKEKIQTVFHRARARGDWVGPADVDLAYDVLFGTVFARCTAHGNPFTHTDARLLAKTILCAVEVERAAG